MMKSGGLQKITKQKKIKKSSDECQDGLVRFSNHPQFQALAPFFDSQKSEVSDSILRREVSREGFVSEDFPFPSDDEMTKVLKSVLGEVVLERWLQDPVFQAPDPILFGLPRSIVSVLFSKSWQRGEGIDVKVDCRYEPFSSSIKARVHRLIHAWAHARGLQSLSDVDRRKILYGIVQIVRSPNRIRFSVSESASSMEEKVGEYFAEWTALIFGVQASSEATWLSGIRRETVSRFLSIDDVPLSPEIGIDDARLAYSYLRMLRESFAPWRSMEGVEALLEGEDVACSHRSSRIVLSRFSDKHVRGFISFLVRSQDGDRESCLRGLRSRVDMPAICIPWIEDAFLFVDAFLRAERMDESFVLESSRLESSWKAFSEMDRVFLSRVFRERSFCSL